MSDFTHLHVHTQYSILDGAASIEKLIEKTKNSGMDALAITDHGNMYGVLKFFNEAKKQGVKPIIGCEMYVAEESRMNKRGKQDRSGYHLILLAKNKEGYKNLSRLCSKGFLEGFYYTPRIDKELLRQYHEGIIASSACLGGEIAQAILYKGLEKAEETLKEYLGIFGEDFYLELMDHGIPEQKEVNKALLELSKKYGVKVIATNDVHFVNVDDSEAHNILICLNTNRELQEDSDMSYTGQEFLKTPEEMADIFADCPEAISNTREIVDKIESYSIAQDIVIPHFPLPEGFTNENEYLRHLAYDGAYRLYPDLSDEIKERLDFELGVIKDMGFPGYFLIVQDFINAARKMDVTVGPGRGSAAGSVVAYCTGITNVDPIKYDLLFERFLNPERVSMPDIDVDFDDEGRGKVLKYVVEKYGEERVAQIITFGSMAAKTAIRDVARVLKLPLPEADKLAKLIPERPGITLEQAFKEVPELADEKNRGSELVRKTLRFAQTLEGSARHTGTHACGVIIGPEDLIDHIPLATAKDSELMVTQYDGKLVESVGMLKMDFLGLATLSIIKDAIENIYHRNGIKINIDEIPMDDQQTFELFQRGDTIGTFQFESEGMRTHLRDLKPTTIEDLIAMNALYRPGPMDNIPNFINRKHGRDKIVYPHPSLEHILDKTYGIMVYQEQIMQISKTLAGFSGGKADELRKAMGKKKMDIIEKLRVEFIEGSRKNNDVDEKVAADIYDQMGEFGKYGFNRSHAAAYSIIAYQTGYLKAHYAAEYMASVLTHNLRNIDKITFYIEECKRSGLLVLEPDINESSFNFTVNKKGQIRFGMAAIKGVGEQAVNSIIEERNENGPFTNIFDLAKRVSLRSVNKRCLEALAMAGAFDDFEDTHRAQYFYKESEDDTPFLEKIIKYAANYQSKLNSTQQSLFGETSSVQEQEIQLPVCEPWTTLHQLKLEKEVTGFYMSGHPLDSYRIEMQYFCNTKLGDLKGDLRQLMNQNMIFAGIVSSAAHKMTKTGKPFGSFTLEDFNDSFSFILFSEDYLKMKHFLSEGALLMVNAKVQARYNTSDQLEVKISSITLLPDALDKYTRSVTVFLPLEAVSASLINELQQMMKLNNKGKCSVKFQVIDASENISIELPCKKQLVSNPGFVHTLQSYNKLKFKLN